MTTLKPRPIQRVAEGLRGYLGDKDLPMVPAGLDYLVSIYRQVNSYPHLTEDAVRENPDQLSAEQLRAAAWPVVAEILDRRANRAVRSFAELHGTGRASDNPRIIEAAAAEGRVGTLLMAARPRCGEQFPTASPWFSSALRGPSPTMSSSTGWPPEPCPRAGMYTFSPRRRFPEAVTSPPCSATDL